MSHLSTSKVSWRFCFNCQKVAFDNPSQVRTENNEVDLFVRRERRRLKLVDPTTFHIRPTTAISKQGTAPDDTILAMRLVGSTRIAVSSHRSDLGRWRAAQRPAEPRLRDYVLGYFASEGFLPRPLYERHLPLREVTIVLNFAAPHRIIDPSDPKRTTEHRNAWIVALQHRHQIREAVGARDFMVIRFTPIGAQMLLGGANGPAHGSYSCAGGCR
jgi:hypothetical protein